MADREELTGLSTYRPLRPVVMVDRDGVLNRLVGRGSGGGEAPLRPGDVHLDPGAAEGVTRLRAAGFAVAMVTNQPAAAKGETSLEQVGAVQAEVVRLLAAGGARLDAVRVCLHHPAGAAGNPLSVRCACRKPAPGMLLAVMDELGDDRATSWMIGDSDHDVAAGRAAGVRTVLVQSEGGGHKRTGRPAPHAVVAHMGAAVEAILGGRAGRQAPH